MTKWCQCSTQHAKRAVYPQNPIAAKQLSNYYYLHFLWAFVRKILCLDERVSAMHLALLWFDLTIAGSFLVTLSLSRFLGVSFYFVCVCVFTPVSGHLAKSRCKHIYALDVGATKVSVFLYCVIAIPFSIALYNSNKFTVRFFARYIFILFSSPFFFVSGAFFSMIFLNFPTQWSPLAFSLALKIVCVRFQNGSGTLLARISTRKSTSAQPTDHSNRTPIKGTLPMHMT